MNRCFLLFAALLVAWGGGGHPAQAQPTGDLSSFPFLTLEPSARAAALGGAFGAIADGDVTGMFYNPALLGPATHRQASLTYMNHFGGANAGVVAYSHEARSIGTTFGTGVRFLSWDDTNARNAQGEPIGTFSAGDVALTLGGARAYRQRWRYGANVHVIYSALETARASALSADLGVAYVNAEQLLTAGASIHHVGVTLDGFAGGRETLPFDVRLSASKKLAHAPFRFTLTAYDLANWSDGVVGGSGVDHVLGHFILGTELLLGETLRARIGYNHRRSTELALADRLDFAGVGLGFGIVIQGVHVDYAYNAWSTQGGIHQFTLRTGV